MVGSFFGGSVKIHGSGEIEVYPSVGGFVAIRQINGASEEDCPLVLVRPNDVQELVQAVIECAAGARASWESWKAENHNKGGEE